MNRKKLYNSESLESFKDAKIINGNPNGIINFTDTNFKWALSIWDIMMSYTWYPAEANMSLDANAYTTLTDAEKRAYDLALAQLITNDSIQVNQLMDNMNAYITSPLVNALIARQSFEEALHSKSYAVMVEELGSNSEEIYLLQNTDIGLKRKNQAVADMYLQLSSESVEPHDILMAALGNLVLEGLVFPGGFLALWSMGNKMTASKTMISFIERDETGTHVPLFKNIFRSGYIDIFGSTLVRDESLDNKMINLIKHMCEEEKIWTKYLTKGLLGFSDQAIDMIIEHKANKICEYVNINYIYDKTDGGPLTSIENKCSMLKSDKKTNFFEATVADYSIGSLNMNF